MNKTVPIRAKIGFRLLLLSLLETFFTILFVGMVNEVGVLRNLQVKGKDIHQKEVNVGKERALKILAGI